MATATSAKAFDEVVVEPQYSKAFALVAVATISGGAPRETKWNGGGINEKKDLTAEAVSEAYSNIRLIIDDTFLSKTRVKRPLAYLNGLYSKLFSQEV